MSTTAKQKLDLEKRVVRWQQHRMEKEQMANLPTQLPRTVIAEKDSRVKKRKTVPARDDDDEVVSEAVRIANRHITAQEQRSKRHKPLELIPLPSRGAAAKRTIIQINTTSLPLESFKEEHPPEEPEYIEEDPTARYEISASALQELPSLRHILSQEHRYFARRDSVKKREGLYAEPKPEISAKHIAKVLFEPFGKFGPCVLSATNECQAQLELPLQHPLSESGQPVACMGYVTPEELEAALAGLQEEVLTGNMCEFCERYAINMYVLERGIESHVTEIERPSRYYKAGQPGEYSPSGMIQPVVVKGTRFTDGIFGNVRCWNTSDFAPIVGVIESGGVSVSRIITMEDYSSLTDQYRNDSGERYVRGWREIKPFYSKNEAAFLNTHQISPYEMSFEDTDREFDIAVVIKGYFERRTRPEDALYAQLYSDLMECVHTDDFYTTCPLVDAPPAERWPTWCLHLFDKPPPISTHRIYYAVMIRCNLSQRLLTKGGMPVTVSEKLELFIDAHLPLIYWMDQNRAISDEELFGLVPDPHLGIDIPVIMALYPRFEQHFRRVDLEFIRYVRHSYCRASPITITQRHYLSDQPKRLEQLLHNNLPTVEQLLFDVTPRNLSTSTYTRLTAEYNKLATRISEPHRSSWPPLVNKPATHSSERKEWRVDRNTELLDDMRREYKAVLKQLDSENLEYDILLRILAPSVFCPFPDTVASLSQLDIKELANLVETCNMFTSVLPPETGIAITSHSVAGQPWSDHILLLACLVRVMVSERLHSMEMTENTELRYNLRLFRNSHLRLVRKITEFRPILRSDTELMHIEPREQLSLYDLHVPDDRMELHEGLLPDVLNGLSNVDFMGNSGMDSHELIKILSKVLDRCCNGREFPVMLNKMCEQNPDFNRLVMLMLQLSLKGLFSHDTETVSFYRSLALDELFEASDEEEYKLLVHRFIRDNPILTKEAISETLCYMLEYVPHLRHMLERGYKHMGEWRMRVIANMDMVRYCYTTTGDFSRVEEVVYQRVHLDSNKKIYRHAELGFVNFMCEQIREFDIERYANRLMFDESAQVTDEQRMIVDAFVRVLGPTQIFRLEALKITYMSERMLDVIAAIVELFENNGVKLSGSSKRDNSSNPVREQFLNLTISEYNLMSYFFETLLRYQNIRPIRITNSILLKKQLEKLCERRGVDHVSQLSDLATKVIYSPCCAYFKNAFPVRMDQTGLGFDEVIYDAVDNIYTCGKKDTLATPTSAATTAPRAIRLGKKENIFNTKVARQQARENKKPVCRTTEVMVMDLVGEVFETQTGAKIPKAKKQKETAQRRRRQNLPLPSPPLWITPCCGRIHEYNWLKWTPNGYSCGVCKDNAEVAQALKEAVCECCCITVDTKKHSYKVVRCYDDVFTQRFRRMVFCNRCTEPWKRFGALYCASHIIHGINNGEFAEHVAMNYT